MIYQVFRRNIQVLSQRIPFCTILSELLKAVVALRCLSAHTQSTREEIERRQELLISSVKTKKIRVSWHPCDTSILEAALARGDRRQSEVIYRAWKKGCKFDSWGEHFNYANWLEAFEESGVTPEFYANRHRAYDEVMPWDHLDYLVSKDFFIRENQRAREAKTTPHCRQQCAGCGVNHAVGGACFG